jgi:hypothetical protein
VAINRNTPEGYAILTGKLHILAGMLQMRLLVIIPGMRIMVNNPLSRTLA